MTMKHTASKYQIPIVAAFCIVLMLTTSCSTTKRIPDGEFLYNGLNMKVDAPEGVKMPGDVKSDLVKSVNVKPNNALPLLTPYRRYPFPLGLWVYNNWNDSARGIKGWLYDRLVSQPVLVSDVRPETRIKMLKSILDDNGYFNSSVS